MIASAANCPRHFWCLCEPHTWWRHLAFAQSTHTLGCALLAEALFGWMRHEGEGR